MPCKKMAETLIFYVREFGSLGYQQARSARATRRVIHRLSPVFYNWGVWEFDIN